TLMARIRAIKPEFFDSPGTEKATPLARLLFIAMWCWADDWGIGDANPRRLLGFAFPNDDDERVIPRNFPGIAREVAECYGVVWYEAEGRDWYAIPSWEDHQRTDKRSAKRHPTPDQAKRTLYTDDPVIPRNPTESPGSIHAGTGEQGNRGTGDICASAPAERDDEPDSEFDTWWKNYPRKKGKGQAVKAYKAARETTSAETLLEAVKRQSPTLMSKGSEYCPYPA